MKLKTLKQIKNLKDKRVLVRVDFNVPIKNGKVQDDSRIRASLPTIKYLLENDAKVILVSHLGRPEGMDKKLSLAPVLEKLKQISNFKSTSLEDRFPIFNQLPIVNLEQAKIAIETMKQGQVIMLENIRFFEEEEKNDKKFAKQLAKLVDVFVLDGFAVAHRETASVSGVAKYLPAYAGLLLESEILNLSQLMIKPKKPYIAVLGGAKIETKLPVLKSVLKHADFILLGGGLVNTCLWAKGYEIGKSLLNKDFKKEALRLWKNKKIIFPVDVVVGDLKGKKYRVVNLNKKNEIKNSEAILDIGPATIRLYTKYIKSAQTLVWNGAMGYFEQKPYDIGTLSIARLVASRSKGKAFGVIGGGETIQTMEMVGMMSDIDFISTGGGAMLEFLSGKKLPGLKALIK
ncbi:MAG TPA: phosphoglycerate kinase [Candidatus Magasanikbacteria bacterium]|jgi:phosphoglycerate kinase|nr:phosphoglycerate kinase [Candidatus Magasanikbacteria bacterium]HQL52851.1 phosphoglycerate kinase [Candidatus Magasanikbacteria bacterium]